MEALVSINIDIRMFLVTLLTFSAIRVALIPLVNLVSAHMMIKSNIVVVGLVRLTISAKTGRVLFSIFGKTGR